MPIVESERDFAIEAHSATAVTDVVQLVIGAGHGWEVEHIRYRSMLTSGVARSSVNMYSPAPGHRPAG